MVVQIVPRTSTDHWKIELSQSALSQLQKTEIYSNSVNWVKKKTTWNSRKALQHFLLAFALSLLHSGPEDSTFLSQCGNLVLVPERAEQTLWKNCVGFDLTEGYQKDGGKVLVMVLPNLALSGWKSGLHKTLEATDNNVMLHGANEFNWGKQIYQKPGGNTGERVTLGSQGIGKCPWILRVGIQKATHLPRVGSMLRKDLERHSAFTFGRS